MNFGSWILWATLTIVLTVAAGAGWWWLGWTSLAQIESAMRQGQLQRATRLSTVFVQQEPKSLAGWKLRGEILDRQQDYRSAAEAYEQAVTQAPQSIDLWRRLGMALQQSSQILRAEEAYWKILEKTPTDEQAQTELQWILFHQLRERELETFLEGALSLQPQNYRILFHLLMSSQKPPNPHESFPVLQKADAAAPGQWTVQLGLARCEWRLGHADQAQQAFQSVLASTGQTVPLAWELAEFELEQNRDDEVAQILAWPCLAMLQQDDRWFWLQSQLALKNRRFADAAVFLEKAATARPRELRYLLAQASLLQVLGRQAEAAQKRQEVTTRAAADQALSLIVNRGDLQRQSRRLFQEIARNCRLLQKPEQAAGWEALSRTLPP